MGSAKLPLQFQSVTAVPLSDEERDTQTISLENVGVAIAALQRDGIVVLSNAVDVSHIDELNGILSAEAEVMAKLPTTHFNDPAAGNMSQGPPLEPDLMYRDIWANGPACKVIASILGPKPHVNYVNGNTALGGFTGARQKVHADLTFNHGTFPFAYVTNYYLVDTSEANGGTEIWLGSHRDTTFRDHNNCVAADQKELQMNFEKKGLIGIKEDLIEARREYAPPIQAVVKRGSVVIRDLRLWHAGLSNPSPDPRIMLAFVHTPWWYQCPAKVVLPESAKKLVDSWAEDPDSPVVYDAHYVPSNLDHKKVVFNPNFSSANKGYISQLPDLPRGYVFEVDQLSEG